MTVDYTKPVVSLIDQDSDFRALTLKVLGLREIQVIAFDSAQEFLKVSLQELTGPRCVVIDLGLEGMSALTIEEELRRRGSRVPIIAATGVNDIPLAIQALREGARTLLQKSVAPPDLAQCIASALADDSLGLQTRQDHAALAANLKELSSREYEVMELLIRARNSKEIFSVLGIGVQTVLKHRAQVLRKLDVRNDVELALSVTSFRLASAPKIPPLQPPAGSSGLLPPISYTGGSFA